MHSQNKFGTPNSFQMYNSPQVLNSEMDKYMGNLHKHKIFNNNLSPLCTLCCLHQYDTCLHLLSCCIDKHINTLCTNQHNDVAHTIMDVLLSHMSTWHYTFLHVGTHDNHLLQNAMPSWLLPCTCYLPCCRCLTHPIPYILCIKGKSSIDPPPP